MSMFNTGRVDDNVDIIDAADRLSKAEGIYSVQPFFRNDRIEKDAPLFLQTPNGISATGRKTVIILNFRTILFREKTPLPNLPV